MSISTISVLPSMWPSMMTWSCGVGAAGAEQLPGTVPLVETEPL